MQLTIKELEQLSESLQTELIQKEDLLNHLKNEYTRLESKYKEILIQKEQGDESNCGQLKALEDEINYLKKHFDIEVGLLKDENEILQKELSEILNKQRELNTNSMS